MTMHKTFHSIDNLDRLYLSRKVGGRGLVRYEDIVDISVRWFEDNIKKSKERPETTQTTRRSTEQQ